MLEVTKLGVLEYSKIVNKEFTIFRAFILVPGTGSRDRVAPVRAAGGFADPSAASPGDPTPGAPTTDRIPDRISGQVR